MASGDTLLILTPLAHEAPASGAASLDVRNGHPVLDFGTALATTNSRGLVRWVPANRRIAPSQHEDRDPLRDGFEIDYLHQGGKP